MSIENRVVRAISKQTGNYVFGYFAIIDNVHCVFEIDETNIAKENIEVIPDSVCRCLGKYIKTKYGTTHLLFETDIVTFPELDFVGILQYNEDRCCWEFKELGPYYNCICNGKVIKISELSDYELSQGTLM